MFAAKDKVLLAPPTTVPGQPEAIIASVNIPPRPALLMALQREIRHDDPQLKKVAQLISRDAAMAGKLIQAANSAFFSFPRPVATVEDALHLMGMNRCGALMTGLITKTLMGSGLTMMARFWDVSEKRSKGMAYIATHNKAVAPDLAHTFGLFCDIGIPLLKAHSPSYIETLSIANRTAATGFTDIERNRHGVDHTIIGSMLTEEWGIDSAIIAAIRLHHSPDALYDGTVPVTVRALLATNLIVEKAIQEFRGNSVSLEWAEGGHAACEALDLTSADVEAACLELKSRF